MPILASATRAFDAGIVARGDGELEAPSCRAEAKFEGCCKGREGLAKSSRPAFEGRLRHARCRHVLPFLTLTYGCYRNNEASWVPNYPQSRQPRLVDYDVLEQWLAQHLPAPDQLEALVIFTDTRPLEKVGAWKYTKRLWQHRFSRKGSSQGRWRGLFVPLTADTGLAEVQRTWGGVFVAEAIALPCAQLGTSCYQTLMLRPQPSSKSRNLSNSASSSHTKDSALANQASL